MSLGMLFLRHFPTISNFVVKTAQLLPLVVLPAMGNTGVCPIAVNPTEHCICTVLTTKYGQPISANKKIPAMDRTL